MLAAIDVGSNAIRFLISNVEELTQEKPVKKNAYLRIPIRLGTDVFLYGAISEQKQAAFLDAMSGVAHIMRAYGVDHYRICATSAMRDAANGRDIMDMVRERTGLRIDIISGLEEAQILFNANALSRYTDVRSALYVDVGGGSTEVVALRDGKLMETFSFQLGTVRILAKAVDPEERRRFDAEMGRLGETYAPQCVIASGGNINKVAKLLEKRDGKPVGASELRALHKDMLGLTLKERMEKYGLNAYRADVIVPALGIFLGVVDATGAKQLVIPKIGLVDGIIRHMWLNADSLKDRACPRDPKQDKTI